jgi:hypothetical protein
LPVSLFRSGTYVLPVVMINDVDSKISRTQIELARLIDRFALAYPGLIEVAKQKLPGEERGHAGRPYSTRPIIRPSSGCGTPSASPPSTSRSGCPPS